MAALYSTGAVGRYTAAELLRPINYLEKKPRWPAEAPHLRPESLLMRLSSKPGS